VLRNEMTALLPKAHMIHRFEHPFFGRAIKMRERGTMPLFVSGS
jgi:hypothetical protein